MEDILPIHELRVPDSLIEWAKDPERARSWTRPWGHILARMLRYAETHTLSPRECESVLTTLEAVCVEAIRAGEHELLLGIDLLTADWLGLVFDVEMKDGSTVSFGEDFAYSELHVLVDAGPECVPAAQKAKALVSEVFPQAKIDAMIRTEEMPPDECAGGCGTRGARVMVTLDKGNRYCRRCYSRMTRKISGAA